MPKFSLSTAWDESRRIFARDGGLIVSVALALVVLPTVIVGLVVPPNTDAQTGWHVVIQFVGALIALVGQLAIIRLAIGPATTVGAAILHGARRFPAALGALLLLGLLMAAVMVPILLIFGVAGLLTADSAGVPSGAAAAVVLIVVIAALLIAVRFALTAPVASAEPIGPISILKRSWVLTGGHYWKMLGFVVLLLILALVIVAAASALGGIIGALVSPDLEPFSLGLLILALFAAVAQGAFTIISSVMLSRIYVQLAGPADEEVAEVFR